MARTQTRKGAGGSSDAPPPGGTARRRRSRPPATSPRPAEAVQPQKESVDTADVAPAPSAPTAPHARPTGGSERAGFGFGSGSDSDSDTAIGRIRESVAARLSRGSTWSAWAVTGIAVIAMAGIVAIAVAQTVGDLNAERPGAPPGTAAAPDDLLGPGGDAGAVILEETFDGLPMDSSLPSSWIVAGGGGASIVALPTSVDRSVRIRSSPEGDPASACHPTGVDATAILRLAVDIVVGGRAGEAVPLLALEGSGTRILTIGLGPAGELVQLDPAPDSGVPAPEGLAADAEGWRRLDVRLDPNERSVEWQARDVSGTQVAVGRSTLEPGTWADGLCLFSPQGAPSSWIAVDDLVVRG
jgi:hypothetical protein